MNPKLSRSGLSGPHPIVNCSENIQYVEKHSKRFIVGFADTIGRRSSMEDQMLIHGQFMDNEKLDLFALFDGHCGKEVSYYCSKNIADVFAKQLKLNDDNPGQALHYSFKELSDFSKEHYKNGGSTALVVFISDQKCYIANAGDSRAVICCIDSEKNSFSRLTTDHKPDLPREKERIENLGGYITTKLVGERIISRISGVISVSRAIGDGNVEPFLIPDPDITELYFDTNDEKSKRYLILACDGVWDVLNDNEVHDIVVKNENLPNKNVEDIAKEIRDTAFSKSSTDNISVMVIQI